MLIVPSFNDSRKSIWLTDSGEFIREEYHLSRFNKIEIQNMIQGTYIVYEPLHDIYTDDLKIVAYLVPFSTSIDIIALPERLPKYITRQKFAYNILFYDKHIHIKYKYNIEFS